MKPLLALLLLTPLAAMAALREPIALARYEARTLVTGTDMRSRPHGLAVTLTDVLVKVSGDPTLADDPRLPPILAHAEDDVADADYQDRMGGLPHHDEQGSSDRPFYFTVRFAPARIDALLRTLGRTPWPDPRPSLVPLIRVQATRGAFDLTTAEPHGDGMRAAWAEAGQRYGLAVDIPAAFSVPPAGAALTGTLTYSDAALGWVGSWHLTWQGRDYAWGVSGVNFDEAFRDAARGALQILSGHGAPH